MRIIEGGWVTGARADMNDGRELIMMKHRTRREAVLCALRHEDVHPTPYFLDMTDEVARRMCAVTHDPLFFEHSGSYLAQARNESFTDLAGGLFRDQFGVVWDKGAQEGDFGIVHEYLLKEPTLSGYVFPEPDEAEIRKKCEQLCAHKDQFTQYIIGFSLFERAWTLRSMDELLCDMLEEPAFVDELMDAIVLYNLKVVDIVCEYPIDCVFFGDDWGMQKGLIMGYPLWKRFIGPRIEREYAYVKAKGRFVAQHSCGDCAQVFPDLVRYGLDIYNTFQPEVYDIEWFKKTYGHAITFFGGISTQTLLPFATPDQVEKETRRILQVLSPNGGYILAPTHAMPGDIPPENVLAFLKVCREQDETPPA